MTPDQDPLPFYTPLMGTPNDGWVYCGTGPMTTDHVQALMDFAGGKDHDPEIDPRSVVGMHDPFWSTAAVAAQFAKSRPGEAYINPTLTYRLQHVGYGVEFMYTGDQPKEDREEVWYYDDEGRKRGVLPGLGAFHKDEETGGIRLGPRPGTPAAEIAESDDFVGYAWNSDARLYEVLRRTLGVEVDELF